MSKKKPKNKNPHLTEHTMVEMLAGRIHALYAQDPHRAEAVLEWLLNTIRTEGDVLMRQTYTIEVKINFDDDERHKVMFHLMRKAARQLVGQVQLLADNPNRPAEVMFQTNDFYEGGTQHTLANLPEFDEEFDEELKPDEDPA